MKFPSILLAAILLCGCHRVPESMESGDGGTDSATEDATTGTDLSADAGTDAGGGEPFTVPFPKFEVGLGGTYAGANDVQRLRRRLLFRFNANLFVGSAAQVVGRASDFDAIFIDSADAVELAALENAEVPVFMTSDVGAERLGLAGEREAYVPLLSIDLTEDHPRRDVYDGIDLLVTNSEVYLHPEFAPDAVTFAEGTTEADTVPVLIGVETDGQLLGDRVAPARRGYFAVRDYRELNMFGAEAITDAVEWTFGFERPPSDKACGVITPLDQLSGGSFAERLKLHGCDVQIIDPASIDVSGLDLVVIGPDVDQVAVGQLLAPQDVPVVVFYEGTSLAFGFEVLDDEDLWEQTTLSSLDITTAAQDIIGTPASGTIDITAYEVNYYSLATDSVVEGVEVLANLPTGQPAALAVDRDVAFATVTTKARRVFLPSPMLGAYNSEGVYTPSSEAIEFVDYAIQWTLDGEE